MTITDDELKAQAESYTAADAASRGPRHAGISDEELCKALRHRAGLPETCATDAYVMLQAEQRIKLALRQSSPPDGQTAGEPEGYREAIIGVLRPAGNIAFNMKQQAIYTSDRDNYRRISVAIDAALDLLRDTPSSETKAPGEEH